MNKLTIPLPKGKYISQLPHFKKFGLTTNTIYHKLEPGCGFTTYFIKYYLANVIGLLPNKPVVEDKVADHNGKHPKEEQILGVYQGITINHIKAYLLRTDIKHKKILTTPEGFIDKVVKAFKDIQEMYQNFFMVIDECERIITDVSYRGKIAAPMNHLFKFTNKALVSATTLPFSDKRFEDFNHYIIEPQYDYSKPITLINSNNIIESVKQTLDKLSSKHVAIFFNSAKGIAAVAKGLDIVKDSKAFCADDSVVTLLDNKYPNGSDRFNTEYMAKYTFFTSRYFSAIDMKVDYKPDIILISDVYFSNFSILDPSTEVIQIGGRFRNGIKSLTHISNFNPDIESKAEDEARFYLQGKFETYNDFVRNHERTNNPGSRDTLAKAINESDAKNYFHDDGTLNTFMADNFVYEERVKGYYRNFDLLGAAYGEKAKYFKVTTEEHQFTVTDKDLHDLAGGQTKPEKHRQAALLFEKWTSTATRFFLFPPVTVLNKLVAKYPDVYQGFRLLGLDGLEATGYVLSEIRKAVTMARKHNELLRIAQYVHLLFNVGSFYTEEHILATLTELYAKYTYDRKPRAAQIKDFFETRRTQEGGINGYMIKAVIQIV